MGQQRSEGSKQSELGTDATTATSWQPKPGERSTVVGLVKMAKLEAKLAELEWRQERLEWMLLIALAVMIGFVAWSNWS